MGKDSTLRTGVQVTSQGHLMTAKGCGGDTGGRGKRGVVLGFSSASRARLIAYVLTIDDRMLEGALWCRLSWADEAIPTSGREVKAQLKRLADRFRLAFPSGGYVWKLEVQDRKSGVNRGLWVPHVHLLVLGVDLGELGFLVWLSEAWSGVVGCGLDKFKAYGVDVRPVGEDVGKLIAYLFKYLTKVQEDGALSSWGWLGRWWGVVGRGNIRLAGAVEVGASGQQWLEFRRLVRAWLCRRAGSERARAARRAYAGALARLPVGFGMSVFGMSQGVTVKLLAHASRLALDREIGPQHEQNGG